MISSKRDKFSNFKQMSNQWQVTQMSLLDDVQPLPALAGLTKNDNAISSLVKQWLGKHSSYPHKIRNCTNPITTYYCISYNSAT